MSKNLIINGVSELIEWKNQVAQIEPKCYFVLIGTKSDLIATSNPNKLMELSEPAKTVEMTMVLATSARWGNGITEMFEAIARFGHEEIFSIKQSPKSLEHIPCDRMHLEKVQM
jgi:GTPase SAR1 family protein